jgi:hypothetical protein
MKLETASWTSGGGYAALAEETNLLSYAINHNFNRPAECRITLRDNTGSIAQKYDTTYVGAGKAVIEDPTGTQIFYGRILKAQHDTEAHQTVLFCKDWLCQLEDMRINYDMREDIDGSGLRESTILCDLNAATCVPVDSAGGGVYNIFDDNMSGTWGNDDWNGYYVVLPNSIAGNITVTTGPSSISISNANFDTKPLATDTSKLWVDDTNTATLADNDGELCYYYLEFQLNATVGSLYNSISEMRINFTASLQDSTVNADFGALHTNEATKYKLGEVVNVAAAEEIRRYSFTVPENIIANLLETDGTIEFYWLITSDNPAITYFKLYYASLEVDINTDGYADSIAITDTVGTPARLDVSTDVDVTGLGLWNGCPYSICQPIYKHIDTNEGGTLVSDPLGAAGAHLVGLVSAAGIEHTSGITTRNYQERTPMEILQDLCRMDKAVFYNPLTHGAQMNWKSTFNSGAPTAMTDASVISWSGGEWDATVMRNEYHVYGVRIGDSQLYVNTADLAPDPGVTSKTAYGYTASEVVRSTGTTSEFETEELGKALVGRDDDIYLFLSCTIAGLDSTYRLATEVSITSTYLDLTAEKYVVTNWSYDSKEHKTVLRLHPRAASTKGFVDKVPFGEHLRRLYEQNRQAQADIYAPGLYTQDW